MSAGRAGGVALACVLVGGCTLGPDFHVPAAPDAARYTAEPLAPSVGDASAVQVFHSELDIAADWWTAFRSQALSALVAQALAANPDLQAADAALRAAREGVQSQRAGLMPSVTAELNSTRQTVAPVLASPLDSGATRYSLHTAQLNVSYAPDVFGLNRRQVESAEAQADTQRYQLEAARVTIATNVVQAAIQWSSARAQIEATRELIALNRRQLDLYVRQQRLGQVGASDVAAQEAALAQVEAALPPLDKQAAQQRNLLATLCGNLPVAALDAIPTLGELQLPAELPLSLPARLVAQRPDVRAAEAQWRGANAQVGVAIANRWPSFSLSAGAGWTAQQFSTLFGAGTGFWGVGATVLQPLFDGGALTHRQHAAEAGEAQAAAQYRAVVLSAFQSVADTLEAIQADARTAAAADTAERVARLSLQLARRQASAGATGVLPVLNAEQALRQATISAIQAHAGRLSDSAALYQALGGGWWRRDVAAGP